MWQAQAPDLVSAPPPPFWQVGRPLLQQLVLDGPAPRSGGSTSSRQQRSALRSHVISLAHCSGALDLRLARLACHAQVMDLRPLGYGSFTSFVQEELDWQPARQRELARLLRSDLDLIKSAVAQGVVRVSQATALPGRLRVDQQAAWIAACGQGPDWPSQTGDTVQDPTPAVLGARDAETVWRARQLTRLLLGYAAPDAICDREILAAHRAQRPPHALLGDALKTPPRPDLSLPTWPNGSLQDPAEDLLGPWQAPASLSQAVEMIGAVQHLRRQRRPRLGRVLERIAHSRAYLDWGYASLDDFLQAELDLSLRSAQRLRRLSRTLAQQPRLGRAVEKGMSLSTIQAVGRLSSTDEQTRQWLDLAPHLPRRELADAARSADLLGRTAQLKAFQALLDQSPTMVARAMSTRAAAHATETGVRRLGTVDPDRIQVARHPHSPDRLARRRAWAPGHSLRVPMALVKASRWLLATVAIPRQRGYGRIKDHQHYICQNPRCRRRSLRNHAHHDLPRALGGGDEDDNLRCLCPSCHLRLVHGGFMAVVRIDKAHVYLFPDRAIVVR